MRIASAAIFATEQSALLGEALLRSRNIVADMREGGIPEHDPGGCDLDQLIGRVHAADFLLWSAGDGIDRHRYVGRRHRHLEPMRRRNGSGAVVEIVQGGAHGHRDARLRRPPPQRDRRDHDLAELVANGLVAERRIAAVERLKAAGEQSGRGEHDGEPRQWLCTMLKRPH